MKRLVVLLALLLAGCGSTQAAASLPPSQSGTAPESTAAAPAPTATPLPAVDGTIAFSKDHDVWVYSGNGARRLTSLGSVQNPAWSPDGSMLAFDRAGKNSADLWLLPYPDGQPRVLTSNTSPVVDNNFWEMQPAWSPDGSSLVYASDRGRVRTGTLDLAAWQMMLATGARAQLSGANAYTGGIDYPSWRPNADSAQILYTSWTYLLNNPEAYGQLDLLDVRTRQPTALTEHGETVMQASWAPSGDRIAFVRRIDGGDQIWQAPVPFIVSADTDVLPGATLVAAGTNAHPVWSPKGDAIAYIGLKDGSFDLFVQPLTGSLVPDRPPRQLTSGLHIDADSSISWRR